MGLKSGSLDYWRGYFGTANSDIFTIINQAILVAVSDCPKEFRLRRDQIAERLFSCRLSRCLGCDRMELTAAGDDADDGEYKGAGEFEAGGSKGSKVDCSRDDQLEMNMNQVSNYSFDEPEALTNEIEEATHAFEEVLRIKDIISNSEDESDSLVSDCLRRLELMALNVDTLKATEIGKAVNNLRKHSSKQIRNLARSLIEGWKNLVDEWVSATKSIAEGTPDSVNPSLLEEDDEEGLPAPPLDEAFFATQPTAMELSQFFDGLDDYGNPQNSGEFNNNCETGQKSTLEKTYTMRRKVESTKEANVLKMDKGEQVKKLEAIVKPNRPLNTESGPGRPPKSNMEQKVNHGMKPQQKSDNAPIQRRPLNGQQNKSKCSDEDVQVKLEATKRRLQEHYKQAENAKRQRTIQFMELRDLPKQGSGPKNQQVRPGNHNRRRENGRHYIN